MAWLHGELVAGRTTSRQLVDQALKQIEDPGGEGCRAFMKVYGESARAQADAADALRASGVVRSPVDGIPVSIKDLFDIAGDVTRAGSKALAGAPPAEADAPAVARLRAAGAIILGRTVTVEFAFGGVGLNPHYGTPRNPFDRASGGRIPGGSSAGAAVAVADGMCTMGLGSDTRGSVRIPSALCGVTGFKPTASRVPKTGVFPLSYSFDSVGPLANSVACCAVYDAILAGEEPSTAAAPEPLPVTGLRLLLPTCSLLQDLDPHVSIAFKRSVEALNAAGARIVEMDMEILTDAQEQFRNGGLVAPEAYQIHRPILEKHKSEYDPRVASRVALGASFSAADYIQLGLDRKHLISRVSALMRPYDAMIYPTVAITAPTIAEVSGSDEDYVRCNLKLLRNTGIMNLLDGCAATIPCHRPGEPPVGLSIAGMGGTDKHVLAVAQAVEAALSCISGGTSGTEPSAKRAKIG